MAKSIKSTGTSAKISFGRRRKGKACKTSGPKDKAQSVYRGQGK